MEEKIIEKSKGKILAFALGLIVGSRVLPWFMHLTYITIIILIIFFLKKP